MKNPVTMENMKKTMVRYPFLSRRLSNLEQLSRSDRWLPVVQLAEELLRPLAITMILPHLRV